MPGLRGLRPRCAAVTGRGERCNGQALKDGFCWRHTKLDIPAFGVSEEGRERRRERARETMNTLWATRWKDGRPISEETRARIVEAQKRRSPESRRHSAETRQKISEGHRRRAAKKEAQHA
jgi:hypothetical protein